MQYIGPGIYTSLNRVGAPTLSMPITSDIPYPATAARYIHTRSTSGSPSPKDEFRNLPTTALEPASPIARSSHGGAYLGRRSDSVSPVLTASAHTSTHHGTANYVPPSYGYRPLASTGRGGSGNSGSGGTSQPSLTATAVAPRVSDSRLEDIHQPESEQYSRPTSSTALMGIAYEPEPVPHERQIVTALRDVQGAYDGIGSPLPEDTAAMSVGSRSMYSHEDGESYDEADAVPRPDSRLDPLMRMSGGLTSAVSVGPRDDLDYMRRVVVCLSRCLEIMHSKRAL